MAINDTSSRIDKPLISVIVPIYGIERYLGICIESIIKQTYTNLEIILVDDGSTDRCPEICDLYAMKDSRIRVIHKSNGGLVSARKAGVIEATGLFIGYVDGDDWVEPDYYESLFNALDVHNADLVVAGQSRDLFEKSIPLLNYLPSGYYTGDKLDYLRSNMLSFSAFYRLGITTYVWNKLFKSTQVKYYQSLVDERITIGEDAAVVYPLILSCERIVITDNSGYHYRQREDSMLKKSLPFSQDVVRLRVLFEHLNRFLYDDCGRYGLSKQIQDFLLSICIIRSGGILTNQKGVYFPFNKDISGKNIVVFSAGTFGQQLVNRIKEHTYCNIIAWVDDDYWEYRRCCLNVDEVESIHQLIFDYIIIAPVDYVLSKNIFTRLMAMGIDPNKILVVECPEKNRETVLSMYLENYQS
jgi:glycosyltransferase involved in cell wall biosynthesis